MDDSADLFPPHHEGAEAEGAELLVIETEGEAALLESFILLRSGECYIVCSGVLFVAICALCLT